MCVVYNFHSSYYRMDGAQTRPGAAVELADYGQLHEQESIETVSNQVVSTSSNGDEPLVRLQPLRGLHKVRLHLRLLLLKNWIITTRNLRNTLFLFFSPLATVLTLVLWQYMVRRILLLFVFTSFLLLKTTTLSA